MLKDIFLLASWKRGKKKILSSTKTQGDLGRFFSLWKICLTGKIIADLQSIDHSWIWVCCFWGLASCSDHLPDHSHDHGFATACLPACLLLVVAPSISSSPAPTKNLCNLVPGLGEVTFILLGPNPIGTRTMGFFDESV